MLEEMHGVAALPRRPLLGADARGLCAENELYPHVWVRVEQEGRKPSYNL